MLVGTREDLAIDTGTGDGPLCEGAQASASLIGSVGEVKG